MGNCIVVQGKPVRVMKTDGKIIEYKGPIKVHQVLSEFSHHGISDKLPVGNHLHPNDEMLQGQLYYLLPLPVAEKKTNAKKKKMVRFSDDVMEMEEPGKMPGVVRIKVVISKKDLQAMLGKEGISVGDVISDQVQTGPSVYEVESIGRDGSISSRGWSPGTSPALETIPE